MRWTLSTPISLLVTTVVATLPCSPEAIKAILPASTSLLYAIPDSANASFSNFSDIAYPINATGLPAFCAIQVNGPQPDSDLNATDYNITAFHARGGKLLQYHGYADGVIPPGSSTYRALTEPGQLGILTELADRFSELPCKLEQWSVNGEKKKDGTYTSVLFRRLLHEEEGGTILPCRSR